MVTSTLQFTQSIVPQLYFLPDGAGRSAAFLLPPGASGPSSLALQQSWTDYPDGCYIFLDRPVASGAEQRFAAAAWSYLGAYVGPRFAWLFNRDAATYGVQGYVTSAFRPPNSPAALTRRITTFDFRGMTVVIGAGCSVEVDPNTDAFIVKQADATNKSIHLLSELGETSLFVVGASVVIPLGDGQSGCLNFPVTLGTTEGRSALAHLDVGLRTFVEDPLYVDPDGTFLTSLRYPVFTEPQAPIDLQACLDPLAPLDAMRTSFSFAAATALPSNYSTPVGYPVSLTPQVGSARLIFAHRPLADASRENDPLYLTPAGQFEVSLGSPGTGPVFGTSVMCGLSAVEYLDLQQLNGAALTFVPGQSACVPVQTPQGPTSDPSTWALGALTNRATTSWAYVSVPQGVVGYYAQPDTSVLYTPRSGNQPTEFMRYLPVLAGSLPDVAPADARPFPLMPYKGIGSDGLALHRQLEIQVLSPTRRAAIPPPAVTTGSEQEGTTPEGLLLTLDGTKWEDLVLAHTPDGKDVQIGNVTGALKTGFQSNKLFMVVSSPDKFSQCCDCPYQLTQGIVDDLHNQKKLSDTAHDCLVALLKGGPSQLYDTAADFQAWLKQNLTSADYSAYQEILTVYAGFSLPLAGWIFDLTVGTWQEHGTILIFKYCDKSVQDLVNSTASWAQADALNDDVTGVQQQLQQIIGDAVAKGSSDPYFGAFVQRVTSAAWNGVLALQVRVPLDGLPSQLEGIAAGIDTTLFDAHHIGFDVSRVQLTNGSTLSLGDTSLFGLIYYQDTADLVSAAVDYQFKVLSLTIAFNNSQVVGFSSRIELLINSLFGEPARLLDSQHGNNLILTGTYHKQNGGGTYLFLNDSVNVYEMTSAVLNRIEFTQAQFVTIVPPTGLKSGQNVETKFLLAGRLDFSALAGFDVLSFGSAGSFSGGLSYSSLSIDMSFDPDQPSYKTFAFDAQHIIFDLSTSLPRPASLYSHFPIKLQSLVQAADGVTPATMGYMPVDSPLNETEMSGSWYGLVFDLNLGSLGALAGKAGFTGNALAAWAPSKDGYKVFIGLKMPGVNGGAREIAIEQVIKLTFGDIRFVTNDSTYILQLRNIALHLLKVTFPPNGQTEILLFGDPKGQDNSVLGWYAAYSKVDQTAGGSGGQKQLAGPS